MGYNTSIAVVGIIVFEDNVLMLHRTNEPICWSPPGGRLLTGEDIYDGLKREVFEETKLECDIIQPVSV